MKRLLPILAAAALTAGAAHAAPQVQAAWSRPALQDGMGAGFMTITNPGPKADVLVSVASPVAREVQIHQSSMAGGMASMRRLETVPVGIGETVVFKPGSYHLMLMGLTRPLNIGDKAPVTLTFKSGAKVTVPFVVSLAAPTATPAAKP